MSPNQENVYDEAAMPISLNRYYCTSAEYVYDAHQYACLFAFNVDGAAYTISFIGVFKWSNCCGTSMCMFLLNKICIMRGMVRDYTSKETQLILKNRFIYFIIFSSYILHNSVCRANQYISVSIYVSFKSSIDKCLPTPTCMYFIYHLFLFVITSEKIIFSSSFFLSKITHSMCQYR